MKKPLLIKVSVIVIPVALIIITGLLVLLPLKTGDSVCGNNGQRFSIIKHEQQAYDDAVAKGQNVQTCPAVIRDNSHPYIHNTLYLL